MTLRDRCQEILDTISRDRPLRQHSAVDTLEAFVLAEQGRTADHLLDQTMPLVLYFPTVEDREEFIAAVHEAKPGLMSKRMP